MNIKTKAANLKNALGRLNKRRFDEAYNYAHIVIVENFGRGSKEALELEKLKAIFDKETNPAGIFGIHSTDDEKYNQQLKTIFQDFLREEEFKIDSFFKKIKIQLKSPNSEINGLQALQQFFYDSEDPYDWADIALDIFEEVYGPSDKRTRMVKKTIENFPSLEENDENESLAKMDVFKKVENLINDLILKANQKSKSIPINTADSSRQVLQKEKKWFDFSSISSNTWALITTLFIAAVSGAYFLGKDIGFRKFDSEKNTLYEDKINLEKKVEKLEEDLVTARNDMQSSAKDSLSGK